MRVFMHHARICGYCSEGVRKFAVKHNLDYTDFLRNGIEEEILTKLNDAMANAMVEAARQYGA